jgi:hypothetical protein
MVVYTVETVTTILNIIRPIPGRPTFRGLWHLSQTLSECLGKLGHPVHPNFGFAGYMMAPEAFALYSQTGWRDPPDVGEYFQIPSTAITETEQKSEENRWKANKNLRDTFKNIRTALILLFERIIDEAYHSGGTQVAGLGRRGFGNDEPPDIIARLKRLYGKPSLQELDQALLRLNDPMDRNLPVEVMLKSVEEIQMFLMAHPDGDRQMSDVNLISYGTIKLSKCGGLYSKAMERWQAKDNAIQRVWANFRQHYITEYEKLLAEGGGTTLGQDGYGGAFHATESTTDDTSLTESIVRYAERATAAEGKVTELEQRLSQLEIGNQMMVPPPHAAYYAPEMAQFTNQQPVPPPSIFPLLSNNTEDKLRPNNTITATNALAKGAAVPPANSPPILANAPQNINNHRNHTIRTNKERAEALMAEAVAMETETAEETIAAVLDVEDVVQEENKKGPPTRTF